LAARPSQSEAFISSSAIVVSGETKWPLVPPLAPPTGNGKSFRDFLTLPLSTIHLDGEDN
jgi:hypothetical protein